MLYLLRTIERGKEPHEVKSKQRHDIADAIHRAAPEAQVSFDVGRVYVEAERDLGPVLVSLHGVVSYSPAERCALPELEARTVAVARGLLRAGMSFRVDVRRHGQHGFRSPALAAGIGERILAALPGVRVDLQRPDLTLALEIRDEACIIGAGVWPGVDARPAEIETKAVRDEGAEPRFLVDAMLGTLASRLRALGYDTAWRRDTADSLILREAHDEGRIVLTQDRELAGFGGASAHLVESKTAELQLAEVLRRFGLTPHEARLFTRCSVCNTPLERIDKALVEDRLPPLVAEQQSEIWTCKPCDKLYWKGAHFDDLKRALFPRAPGE